MTYYSRWPPQIPTGQNIIQAAPEVKEISGKLPNSFCESPLVFCHNLSRSERRRGLKLPSGLSQMRKQRALQFNAVKLLRRSSRWIVGRWADRADQVSPRSSQAVSFL